MLLKISAVVFIAAALFFAWLGHSGDNPDARALAGMFYAPAAVCGVIGAVLGLIAFIR